MRITESQLRQIIRRTIMESPMDLEKNMTTRSWLRQFKLHPNDTELHQDLAKAWDMMCEMGAGLVFGAGGNKGEICDQISQATGISRNAIAFHVQKAGEMSKAGTCPSGQDFIDAVSSHTSAENARAEEQRRADDKLRVGGMIIRNMSPNGLGAGRPTYGHTDIGTAFAPEGLSDEEAVKWLQSRFSGAPMWKFEMYRDPDSGRIYAYYEIDTSG